MKRVICILSALMILAMSVFIQSYAEELPEMEVISEADIAEELPDMDVEEAEPEEVLAEETGPEIETVEIQPEPGAVVADLERSKIVLCTADHNSYVRIRFSDGSLLNSDGTERTVAFSSSNAKVVSVDDNGLLTAKKTGTANIICSVSYEGEEKQLSCSVKVTKAPSSVTISPQKPTMMVGESGTFTLSFPKGQGSDCRFVSSNESIARVNGSGMVTAVSKGVVTIAAVAGNGKKASAQLTVYAPASMITLDTKDLLLGTGMKHTLQIELPEYEKDVFEWTSTDDRVVRVDSEGNVTAIAPGGAEICVTAKNGNISETCTVECVAGPQELNVRETALKLGKGNIIDPIKDDLITIVPADALTDITVQSSKSSVIAVNADGRVKAVKKGTANLIISTSNGLTEEIRITVLDYPSKMKLSESSVRLGVGMTTRVQPVFGSKTYSAYTFISNDPAVAEVDQNGTIIAKRAGTAEIICKCISGKKKATCTVNVLPAPASISVEQDHISGYVGKTGLSVQGITPKGTLCGFEYEVTSGIDVARVESDTGKLSILKEGMAIITVRATNAESVTAECVVEGVPAPDRIAFAEDTVIIGVGNTLELVASNMIKMYPENADTDLKFSTSAAKVVSVNAAGRIKGLSAKTAKITVKTANGLSDTLTVKVMKYPSAMKLSEKNRTISAGTSFDLGVTFPNKSASLYRFSSSDTGIAVVDESTGRVTGVAPGNCVITCTCVSGKLKADCKVKVLPEPTKISITPERNVIGVGDTLILNAGLNNDCTEPCTFSSLTPELADVDTETGRVFCKETGTARILVTAYNGITEAAEISVVDAPEAIELISPERSEDGYQLVMRRGEPGRIRIDTGAYTAMSVSFESLDPRIAQVDENGNITALTGGTTKIICTAYNGVSVMVDVTVEKWTDGMDTFIIAHAMGGIDGKSYSNSLEAFQLSYSKGMRIFEVDFSDTKDNQIVLWHDWNKRVNSHVKAGVVPTLAQFKAAKIYDKYTSLSLEDLLNLMIRYPDIRVITDSKQASAAAAKKCFTQIVNKAKTMHAEEALDRFIVQIYNEETYTAVESIHHFDAYIFTVYKLFSKAPTDAKLKPVIEFCATHGIDMITMPAEWWKNSFMDTAAKYDVKIAVHTVNSAAEAKEFFNAGVTAIYSDFLSGNV